MVERSRIRHLLLLGLSVALAAHLWMLHEAMPGGEGGTVLAPAESMTAIGVAEVAPGPSGREHNPGMQFTVFTCLAVLIGATASLLAAAVRNQAMARHSPAVLRVARGLRARGWPPSLPSPSRVDAGVLLVV